MELILNGYRSLLTVNTVSITKYVTNFRYNYIYKFTKKLPLYSVHPNYLAQVQTGRKQQKRKENSRYVS